MSDVRSNDAVDQLPAPRQLRPYQVEAASNVEAAWGGVGRGRNPRVAVVLATGCGKSSVISSLATRARAAGKRVLLLAHRTELLEQMAETVGIVEPGGERVGIVAAERNENDTAIVAASFQTLARSDKRVADLGPRDVILADECFPAGTLLAGGCPIDKVTVGRTVASWDEHRRCVVQRKVTRVFKSKPSSLVRVTFDDKSSVVCTEGHPFLVHGSSPHERLWREATFLTKHTRVVQGGAYGERTLRVWNVEDIKPGDDGDFSECRDGYVYNIEVEGTHTYLLANNAVVHNCHHISAPTYLKVLEDLGAMDDDSGVVSCGFTATMYRDDGKALGDVWSEVVFERDLLWAIENGYLIPPRGKTVALDSLNQLAKIRTVGGDYKQSELAEVMSASVESTVDAILRHCPQAAMIVFAAGVDHAQALAESLTASGIPSKDVTGAHNREYREKAYSEFRNGTTNALVTVQVLTEGADFPRCDTVVMARPTRSKVLLTQMIGRSVRQYTDPVTGVAKTDATVLDLTGVVRDVKLMSLTDLLPDAKHEVYNSDGDDITEEVAAADELLGKKPGKERQGRIDLEDIDLMGRPRRKVLWLTTTPINANGDEYMFLPPRTSKSYLFLYPALNRMSNDSLVMLAHRDQFGNVTLLCDANGRPVRGTMVQAMDAAEHMLPSNDLTKVAAEWRKPSVKPTEGQLALGKNLGIEGLEYMSRAELSDRISSNFGTRLIRDAVAKLPANL